MADLVYSPLDLSDTEAVAEYERSLFKAFYPQFKPVDSLTRDVFRSERRIRFKISYADQKVLVARCKGSVIAGVAVNYNTRDRMQLETIGFSIEKPTTGICEGIVLFNNQVIIEGLSIMLTLGDMAYSMLVQRKISTVYGTCSERVVKGYKLLGFEVIDEKVVMGTRKFLLKKHVTGDGRGFHLPR